MSIAIVTSITADQVVNALILEQFRVRVDDQMAGPFYFAGDEPTDEAVIAFALTQGVIYPLEAREVTEVTNKIYNDTDSPDAPWSRQVRQFTWSAQERTVSLSIPRGELPQDYTDAEVIAWGRAAGKLLPVDET